MTYSFDEKGYFTNLSLTDISHIDILVEAATKGEVIISDPYYESWLKQAGFQDKNDIMTYAVVFIQVAAISLKRAYSEQWNYSELQKNDYKSLYLNLLDKYS